MPPRLALVLTIGFIVFLIRRDVREQKNVTAALWIPVAWMFILGSRAVSEWLAIFGLNFGAASLEEGSPLDALFYFGLIGLGVYVLKKRGVTMAEVAQDNRFVTLFLVYCFFAITWSDFPFVAVKRWVKIL